MDVKCVLDGLISGEVLYRAPIVKKVPQKNKSKKRGRFDEEDQTERKINIFGE
jgi:hypothetical protein